MTPPPTDTWRPNVAGIVLDEHDNVLLGVTSRISRHLHFPQGGVSRRESMRDAILRELEEEVGLSPKQLTIIARFGGLRYRYRDKNRKSEIWDGQEQTYFILRCKGTTPELNITHSNEFAHTHWIPWYNLSSDLFVSFKQNVIAQVLEHFFPRTLTTPSLLDHILRKCRTTRYLSPAGHYPQNPDPDDRSLFAGTKESAEGQFTDAQREFVKLQKNAEKNGHSLIVIPFGLPGCNIRSAIRQLARSLDPLRTTIARTYPSAGDTGIAERLRALDPAPGETILLLNSPYDHLQRLDLPPTIPNHTKKNTVDAPTVTNDLSSTTSPAPTISPQQALIKAKKLTPDNTAYHLPPGTTLTQALQQITQAEQELSARGITILRLFFNISPATTTDYCLQKGILMDNALWHHMQDTAYTLMQPSDWYLIPAERKWYRNLIAVRAVAEALGSC